jgi:outer membrane lipoprotein SlyB
MNTRMLVPAILFAMGVGGCSDMPQLGGGPKYGDTSGSMASQSDRNGKITALDVVQVDENYKFGIGTAACSVRRSARATARRWAQCWVRQPARSRAPQSKAR